MTRKPIKWRRGSQAESLAHASAVSTESARCFALPDGHKNAERIMLDRETGEPIRDRSGSIQVCAPWLLSGIFS